MDKRCFLSVREISEIAGVHPVTVRKWIYRGWLAGIKLGGVLRVEKDDFHQFYKVPGMPSGKRKSE